MCLENFLVSLFDGIIIKASSDLVGYCVPDRVFVVLYLGEDISIFLLNST